MLWEHSGGNCVRGRTWRRHCGQRWEQGAPDKGAGEERRESAVLSKNAVHWFGNVLVRISKLEQRISV